MGKRLIFVGTRSSGYFAYEEATAKGWVIDFVETDTNHIKKQVAEISAAAEKGCDAIIYDSRNYLEDAEVIADVISSIRRANGAKPVLLVPTANEKNALIGACLNKDIKLFINTGTGTPTDWKKELVLCITGHYDAEENEPAFTKKAREYNSRKKIKNESYLTVGVAGSCHRIGTTTQAMQITRYLNSMGYKSCYIEMNENRYRNSRILLDPREEISFLEKSRLLFDIEIDEPERGYIRNQGLDMYYKLDALSELQDLNYDFLVYDYGVYSDKGFNKTAFLKDSYKFFCVGANAAEADLTFEIAENVSYRKADLIFSFTAEADREDICEQLKEAADRCYFTEYTPNPYVLTDLELYRNMLPLEEKAGNEEILPKKKKKGLLGRLKHE